MCADVGLKYILRNGVGGSNSKCTCTLDKHHHIVSIGVVYVPSSNELKKKHFPEALLT